MSAHATEPMPQEGYDFMAAAFEVYNAMGHGFTEEIYQESLETELRDRGIPFTAQSEIAVRYKGQPLRKKLRPDLTVFGDIIVELKAVTRWLLSTRPSFSTTSRPPASLSGISSTSAVPTNSNGNGLRGRGRCPNPSASISAN